MKDTPLDREFQRLGLVRFGGVAEALGVDHETIERFTKSGLVRAVPFEWGNKTWRGVPTAELEKLKAKLATVKR